MNFDQAFHTLLGHEGGYSNHPNDPGGETMWGVTAAVARGAGYSGPMRDMPTDTAKGIYRDLYWTPVRADELPAPVRYAVFDAAVNSGPGQAVRWLQRAAGVADDGKLGPVSMAAITAADPEALLRKMLAARLAFMSSLPAWPAFGRGWARRIASLMENAA